MRCCAAGANGCLDLSRRASALDGRMSAEWSRCPGPVTRRGRDSMAPMRRSSAGWMPARILRLSAGVGCRHPVTIRNASLMAVSMRRYEHWGTRQARSTRQLNGPGLGWLFAELLLQRLNRSQQAASGARRVMSASCEVTQGVGDTCATCPTLFRFGSVMAAILKAECTHTMLCDFILGFHRIQAISGSPPTLFGIPCVEPIL